MTKYTIIRDTQHSGVRASKILWVKKHGLGQGKFGSGWPSRRMSTLVAPPKIVGPNPALWFVLC